MSGETHRKIDEKVLYTIERGEYNDLHVKKVTITESSKEVSFYTVREYITGDGKASSYGRGINLTETDLAEVIKGLYKTILESEVGDPSDLLSELSGMRQTRRLRRKDG